MTVTHERAVRDFYTFAGPAYDTLMGRERGWFHGVNTGGTPQEASDAMLDRLAQHLQLGPGFRLFEFGAGTGGGAVQIALRYPVVEIVGVSNNDVLSERARQLAIDSQVGERVSFWTIGDLDYKRFGGWPPHSFHAVFTAEALCHLPDKPAFFGAAHRLLKPGGRLVVLDWLQRPFGDYQTPDQIASVIDPVCRQYALAPPLGSLDSYQQMMRDACFDVLEAHDEYAGELCLGSTEPPELWQEYDGPQKEKIAEQKIALDAARAAGPFTVGWFVGEKPAGATDDECDGFESWA